MIYPVMKYTFLFFILFSSCQAAEKKATGETGADSSVVETTIPPATDSVINDEAKIASIRAAVQNINTQTLQEQTFNWSWPNCADEGTISYYLNNKEIVKVIESGFIGDGSWTKEYYYTDGKFIFSFEQMIGGAAAMKADTNEIRLYADNDTLVLQKKNKTYLEDGPKRWTAASMEYKILKALKQKNFGEVLCGPVK